MWHENICDFSWWQSWALQILWFAVSIHRGRKWYISVRGEWRERYNLFSLPSLPTLPHSMKIPCHCWSWRWAGKGSDPSICQHREVLLRRVSSVAIMGGSEKQAPAAGKPEIFTGPAPSSLQPWWVTKCPFSGRPNINSSGLSWEQDVCLLFKIADMAKCSGLQLQLIII